ncbi:MAG: radical SAM superfamily enzyme YgiQ (UPF0313 family) [Planctomycetota bacterium]
MPHVAFVAFTGFRIHEERLLALGMTLPGFARRGQAIAALPALGLLTLAGMTPEHWGRSWHEAAGCDEQVLQDVVQQRPTLVAVSALTASIEDAYAFCDQLRAQGVLVAIGGLHATALPGEVLQHADAVCVGDGEPVWHEILRDAERGSMAGRYQADAPFDLALAPLPAFALPGTADRPRFTLQTERGCPFACEFCAASRMLGPFREKPIERIQAELEAIKAIDARPLIELADDNTFAGKRDAKQLLAVFRDAGVRTFTEVDWRIGEQPELLQALAESGCRQVLIGIESLVFQHPGMGKKAVERERVMAAVHAVQAAGVVVNACFIIGADGETAASLDQLAEFVMSADLAEVQITLQTPFPGSALHTRMIRENRMLPNRSWRDHTLFDLTYQPDRMTVEDLEQGFHDLLSRVFGSEPSQRRETARRNIWKRRRELTR